MLFSFERQALRRPAFVLELEGGFGLSGGRSPAHLENCIVACGDLIDIQENKGTRWMPWHQEPMKDAEGCDKPRGAA